MKLPDKDKFVEVTLPTFTENEVQKRLRAILDYWGPNGERHYKHDMGPTYAGECGERRCVIRVHNHLFGERTFRGSVVDDLCSRAADELGFIGVAACSDSSFENARKMVLRAIELAA